MDLLMRMPLEGGGDLYVELADEEPGVRRASRGDEVVEASAQSLEKALSPISRAASAALEALRKVEPDEVELEFGIRLNVQAGMVIAKTGTGGHLRVKLVWKNGSGEA